MATGQGDEREAVRIGRGVAVGSAVAFTGIALIALVGALVAPDALATGSFAALATYLLLVAAASVLGGWIAGKVSGTQPFASAALVAIVLGVGTFVGGQLVAVITGGTMGIGGLSAGIAPGGAILGGLLNWAGSEG